MADLTWIDVVDSTVKIMAGATIAGIFTHFVSKSRQDHEMRKTKYEQELNIMIDIVEKIEVANDLVNDYSHLSRSVILPNDAALAKENSKLIMSSFKAMTRAKGLAFLIGQKELSTTLEKTCESLVEFYYLASEDIPNADAAEVTEKLKEASAKLGVLNTYMKELRLNVSESYGNVSVA